MNEAKSVDRFATPNSSKLAQILLQLRGVDPELSIDANLQRIQNNELTENDNNINNIPESDENGIDNFEDVNIQDSEPQMDHCNCRKSKCLKLYCQCFATKDYCSTLCRCIYCENQPDKESIRENAVISILERNPNAFDSKYKPAVSSTANTFTFAVSSTSTQSIAHKNGCRCRKSMCLKKYCECFQGGVTCSSICTCLDCHNTGDSNALIGTIASEDPQIDVSLVKYHNLSIAGDYPEQKNNKKTEETSSKIDKLAVLKPFATNTSSYTKPPLVPSNKRKRDSHLGNDVPMHFQDNGAQYVMQVSESQKTGLNESDNIVPITPSLSREHQQRLLEQLLYQELENQGLLSSPFVSLVNFNSPHPFAIQLNANNSHDEIDSSVSKDDFTSGSNQDGNLYVPFSGIVNPGGVRSASPNTINIATALALLAANAQVTQYMQNSSTPIDMYLKQLPCTDNSTFAAAYNSNIVNLGSNSAITPLQPTTYCSVDNIPKETIATTDSIKTIDSCDLIVNNNKTVPIYYNLQLSKSQLVSNGGETNMSTSVSDSSGEEFKQHQSELAADKENSPHSVTAFLNQIPAVHPDLDKRVITQQ